MRENVRIVSTKNKKGVIADSLCVGIPPDSYRDRMALKSATIAWTLPPLAQERRRDALRAALHPESIKINMNCKL